MSIRVAINGFGRIGRLILRILTESQESGVEIVAINDLVSPANLAYLLKYDSVHGKARSDIHADKDSIIVNGKKIVVFAEKDITHLPWKQTLVDYVIEATGHFTQASEAKKHLDIGAKRVIITAPAKGDVPTLVMGVNHTTYNPNTDRVVSNASCTTNCLAVLTKVLLDNFGIDEGLMTTVHSLTASQLTVDGPSNKDWRSGRAAGLNIIPAATGAAKAVELCLPEVKGKLTGMAFRVPTADVSVVDLTVRLSKQTTYEEICEAVKQSSLGAMKEYLLFSEEEAVSSDFIGTSYSCIFDKRAGIALNNRFYKLIAWYDNEKGYAHRVVDLINYMASKEK